MSKENWLERLKKDFKVRLISTVIIGFILYWIPTISDYLRFEVWVGIKWHLILSLCLLSLSLVEFKLYKLKWRIPSLILMVLLLAFLVVSLLIFLIHMFIIFISLLPWKIG